MHGVRSRNVAIALRFTVYIGVLALAIPLGALLCGAFPIPVGALLGLWAANLVRKKWLG